MMCVGQIRSRWALVDGGVIDTFIIQGFESSVKWNVIEISALIKYLILMKRNILINQSQKKYKLVLTNNT